MTNKPEQNEMRTRRKYLFLYHKLSYIIKPKCVSCIQYTLCINFSSNWGYDPIHVNDSIPVFRYRHPDCLETFRPSWTHYENEIKYYRELTRFTLIEMFNPSLTYLEMVHCWTFQLAQCYPLQAQGRLMIVVIVNAVQLLRPSYDHRILCLCSVFGLALE